MIAALTIVSELGQMSAEVALEIIHRVLNDLSISLEGFRLYGKPISLAQVPKSLKAAKRTAFLLESPGWMFHRNTIRQYSMDVFSIKTNLESLRPDNWVNELSTELPITHAWVSDGEYDHWQNAEDPLQYRGTGRTFEHLPMRSNGLPPPLEQMVIDISNNPGRRLLHVGYIEAVGSPMWFGSRFWELTGADKNLVLAESWVNGRELSGGLVRIEPSREPFSSIDSAAMQEQLRNLLYTGKTST